MQMDAYLKKEQIGTLFVWVGALKGEFGGGGGPQGCPPQKSKRATKKTPSCQGAKIKVPFYFSEFFSLHPAWLQVLNPAVSFLQHLETNVLGERSQCLSYKALSFSSNP